MMKRVLCIRFPNWPLQRILNAQPELKQRAVLLYTQAEHGLARVVTCSASLARQGVVPAMPLAEAMALLERVGSFACAEPGTSGPASPSSRNSSLSVHCEQHVPSADWAALCALAWWCRRFSPHVGLEETEFPDSLLLDITGCAHLFGGERGLARQVVRDLQGKGFVVRVAIADTLGAAWAVAHYGSCEPAGQGEPIGLAAQPHPNRETRTGPKTRLAAKKALEIQGQLRCPEGFRTTSRETFKPERSPAAVSVVAPGEQETALRRLPVEALRLPAKVVRTLYELDVRSIGELLALPRAGLPSRFGREIIRRIDQAKGGLAELIVPEEPPEPIEAAWCSEEPLSDGWGIEAVLKRLTGRLVERLEARREGVLQLFCSLKSTGHKPIHFFVGLVRPRASFDHLWELLRLQLAQVSLQTGVSEFRLQASVTAPLETKRRELFALCNNKTEPDQLERLLNRLSNRLGRQAVLRPRLVPDAQPEYAVRYEPLLGNNENPASARQPPGEKRETPEQCSLLPSTFFSARPLRLQRYPVPVAVVSIVPDGPPMRFRWHNHDYLIASSDGPERIETGWWRHPSIRRDYYRVETDRGRRFWLFRNINAATWFLHGEF
jgi:protein ImuB